MPQVLPQASSLVSSQPSPRVSPQVSRYHPLLVALHWFLAVLIFAALALGALVMAKMPNTEPMKIEALRSHMAGGGAILLLMLVRLFVRTRTTHPAAASAGHPALDRLAWLSHRLFYPAEPSMASSAVTVWPQTRLPPLLLAARG